MATTVASRSRICRSRPFSVVRSSSDEANDTTQPYSVRSPDNPDRAETGDEIDRFSADGDRPVDGVPARVDARDGPVGAVRDPNRVCADRDCGGATAHRDPLREPVRCGVEAEDSVADAVDQPHGAVPGVNGLRSEWKTDAGHDSPRARID